MVWDTKEDMPAVVDGRLQTQMLAGDSEDMVDLLNGQWGKKHAASEPYPPPEEDLGGGDVCSLQEQPSTEDDTPLD